MAEEQPEAEGATEMVFADIIGSVFEPELNGITGTLASTEQYMTLARQEGLEPARLEQAKIIKDTFLDLNRKHNMTIVNAKLMIGSMVAFKEAGVCLAQKIENRKISSGGLDRPLWAGARLRKWGALSEKGLARIFFTEYQNCTFPQRRELARRLQECANEWHDLGGLIRKELEALKKTQGVTDELIEEADQQLGLLTNRMLVLTGTIVVLGVFTGGAAFAAAPLVAGGFATLGVFASAFAGLTIGAKAVAVRALGKIRTKRNHLQRVIDSGEAAAEASEGMGTRLEDIAKAVDAADEEAQVWIEMVGPVLIPRDNRSQASLTRLPVAVGEDIAELIDYLEGSVEGEGWRHTCEVWDKEVDKLQEASEVIRSHEDEQKRLKMLLTE